MDSFETELNGTLGSLFLVGLFSVMLYGCTCGQVMYYLRHYYVPGDHMYITSLVILLWVLDTGKTMVDVACGWQLIVLDHGDALILLDKIPAILPGEFVTSCSTIFIVQCCYLYTIWRFLKQSHRHKLWLLFMVPALILTSGSYAAGLVGTIQVQLADNIFDAFVKAKLAGAVRPASAAVVDIYITIWLCYHLHDSKTGHTQSDSMVTKLVNYTLTRGILTSITQVLAFILFLVDYPHKTLWFMIFYIPASTLYVNSLFAMWNARQHVVWSSKPPPTRPSGISTWRLDITSGNRGD